MPSQLGELREGEVVLVRFEIRRAQPSDVGCVLARRRMNSAAGPDAYLYDWVPLAEIVARESPERLPDR